MLAQLARGLQVIGVSAKRRRELIVKVGLDCIPPVRRMALEVFFLDSKTVTTGSVAESIGYPEQTTRRALEDLRAHGVLVSGPKHADRADTWIVSPHWKQQCGALAETFPKSS